MLTMEEIIDEIGSTPSLQPVSAEDTILDEIINSAPSSTPQPAQQPDQQQQRQRSATSTRGGNQSTAKVHTCGFCGAEFSSYVTLVEHKALHGGDRPYQCHVCDKRFTQKAHLIIHKRTHTGEKPYACHICHKRFAQSSHLNSHKRVHTGEKPFFCSICSVGFCRRQRLEAHLQQHAQEVTSIAQSSMADGDGTESEFSSEAADKFPILSGFDLPQMREDGDNGANRATQQAVFPGFSASVAGETNDSADVGIKQEDIPEGEDRSYSSRSRSQNPSSQNSASIPSKSRRKPAFVRRVGADGNRKVTLAGSSAQDDATPLHAGENESNSSNFLDVSKTDVSAAQEAAVDALIRMATGADSVDVDMNDQSAAFDVSIPGMLLKQSLLGTTAKPSVSGSSSNTGSSRSTGASNRQRCGKVAPPDTNSGNGAGVTRSSAGRLPSSTPTSGSSTILSSLIRTNTRVSLVDFTADDLLRHLMSRDDVYRCDFCRVIFHDAALYHLHRSMHDKMDIRCCNLCGKLAVDKYDFTAHFLSQHK